MGQEGRRDEAERKQGKQQGQRRPVLERDEAEKIQHGRIDKVVAKEKDRKGDEDEEWNGNETFREQGLWRAKHAMFILHTGRRNAKDGKCSALAIVPELEPVILFLPRARSDAAYLGL